MNNISIIEPQINHQPFQNGFIGFKKNDIDSRYVNVPKYCKKYIQKGNILDLGCGDGKISKALNKDFNITKVDLIEKEDIIKHNLENVPYPFENQSFDGIICSEVLEHLHNPHNVINESYRILKHDGIMILTVPNFNSIDNILNQYQNLAYTIKYKMSVEHIRNYNINAIKELINRKFEIVDITGNSPHMNPFFVNARNVLSRHFENPDEVIGDCFPDKCTGILFVLKKTNL